MVSFEKMFFVLSRAWDKENILTPHEESNLKPSHSTPRCFTTALRKALKQLEHSPRKKDTLIVYTFEGLQFIFYKDEFKVLLIKNLRRNVLSIGGMVFSTISNAKCKQ